MFNERNIAISTENLTCKFGSRVAVDALNLSVYPISQNLNSSIGDDLKQRSQFAQESL